MICVLPDHLQDVSASVWPGLRIRKCSSKETKCCKNTGFCKNSNMLIYNYIFFISNLTIRVIWSVSNCWEPGCSIGSLKTSSVPRYLIWLADKITVGVVFSLSTMFFHLSFHSSWWNIYQLSWGMWKGMTRAAWHYTFMPQLKLLPLTLAFCWSHSEFSFFTKESCLSVCTE